LYGDFEHPRHFRFAADRAGKARAQERTLDEVLGEAVDRYIKDKQWSALKVYGRAKSRELGLTERDVPRLIAESRQEHGR